MCIFYIGEKLTHENHAETSGLEVYEIIQNNKVDFTNNVAHLFHTTKWKKKKKWKLYV